LSKWEFATDLLKKSTSARKTSRGMDRLAKLAGTARGYTTPIATKNNSKDQLLDYIQVKIQEVNQLGGVDPDMKNKIAEEMWEGYMELAARPNEAFGGTGLHSTMGISDVDSVQGGTSTNTGTSSTRGGLLDEGGFDGESWLDGNGDGY
jgi:hypothetical protein